MISRSVTSLRERAGPAEQTRNSMMSENDRSKQQSGNPEADTAALLWTVLEEMATTQSYLEVMLRNQAFIRAKLEERTSEEVLSEMETDQKSVFQFLWPK